MGTESNRKLDLLKVGKVFLERVRYASCLALSSKPASLRAPAWGCCPYEATKGVKVWLGSHHSGPLAVPREETEGQPKRSLRREVWRVWRRLQGAPGCPGGGGSQEGLW